MQRVRAGRRLPVERFLGVALLALTCAILGASPAAAQHRTSGTPSVAIEPRVQSRAKLVPLRPADFPSGWRPDPSWDPTSEGNQLAPTIACNGHSADLSSVVLRGVWSSRNLFGSAANLEQVGSAAFYLGSPKQAALEYTTFVSLYPRYCVTVGKKEGGSTIESLSRVTFAGITSTAVGFRFEIAGGAPYAALWADTVFAKRGSVLIELTLDRTNKPFPVALERTLVAKILSRAQ